MDERRLYVGGILSVAGWEVYHEMEHPDVDHVGPLDQLKGIANDSVSILYVSALGRLDFRAHALKAMAEWFRVLRPGGVLLCTGVEAAAIGAALTDSPSFDDQVMLTRLLGEQRSHWTPELLANCLQVVGFNNPRRAETFNLFNDISTLKLGERWLSLNTMADKKIQ